jgi:hypothetical protein
MCWSSGNGCFTIPRELIFRHSTRSSGPEYVISSSRTLFLDRSQIVEVLRRTGLDFVAENLHAVWRPLREPGSYRLTELDGWLDSNNLVAARPFVILDDELSGQSIPGSHLEDHAVLCDEGVGFTHPKLKLAQQILHAQLSALST